MEIVKFQRGQIWWYRPGGEFDGHTYNQGKSRPIILVSNNLANKFSPYLLAIPCTSQDKKSMPTHLSFDLNGTLTTALAESLMCINVDKIGDYIGTIDSEGIKEIEEIMLVALGMKEITRPCKIIKHKVGAEPVINISSDADISSLEQDDYEIIRKDIEITKQVVDTINSNKIDLTKVPKKQGRKRYSNDDIIRFINDYENHDVDYMIKKYELKDKHAVHQKVYLFRKKLKEVV